jgi:polysaccharide export outer membrane protein
MTSGRFVLAAALVALGALCNACSGVAPDGNPASPGPNAATSSLSTAASGKNTAAGASHAVASGPHAPSVPNEAGTGPNVVAAAPSATAPAPSTTPTANPDELRLAGGDKVRVIVYGEDKISGDYQLDSAGFLSIPLAGSIQGAGLTKVELERALTQKLKSEYLRNPKVTVEVINYRPFYVLGEVQKPGEYQFRNGLNVLSAIAIAGGATYRANNSTVMIQRSGTTDLKEYPQSPTVLVMPGDVVRVPERFF